MVVLDSNRSHDHVFAELERYAPLVTPRQFLVVADTIVSFIPSEQTPTYYSQVLAPGNDFVAKSRRRLNMSVGGPSAARAIAIAGLPLIGASSNFRHVFS